MIKPKRQPSYHQKDCNLCGSPLATGRTHDGKTIDLDLKSTVYSIIYDRTDEHQGLAIVRTEMAFVAHRHTCPYAEVV
jgi:hypothetical protein